ncbi:redoxin domain-containing protein [Maribellus sediminis]|uniref:redoxin domain-containing protein n=1 Tax=Maribellus sediminis TaxID=2696285 RepID=UPI001430CD92|nr:redoxin domain-containing protein [Maribellus sediminis]
MKKYAFLLFSVFFLIFASYAQDVTLEVKVKFNSNTKADSIYLFFYPTTSISPGQMLPNPEYQFTLHNKTEKIKVYPGAYTFGALAFGSKPLMKRIYIPPVEHFKIDVTFNPAIIGWSGITSFDKISEVTLRGDFNSFSDVGEIPMQKNGNKWILKEKPSVLEEGKAYAFFINGMETSDLLNPKVYPLTQWLLLKNIYSNNDLIFDPSLYSLTYTESELKTSDPELQLEFNELVAAINKWDERKDKLLQNRPPSDEILQNSIDTLLANCSEIKTKDPKLAQMVYDQEVNLMTIRSLLAIQSKKTGDTFVKQFSELFAELNMLSPNSYLLSLETFAYLFYLNDFLTQNPYLTETLNLPPNSISKYIDRFIKESSNKKFCFEILLLEANHKQYSDPEKAIAILNNLKTNPDYSNYTNPLAIESMLAKLTVKIGKTAPLFSITQLNGNTFDLDDFKDKFVFIDFWGSWCPPCRQEIPNIKKLYSSVSHDKLEVIGLIQDDESKARAFIEDLQIEYPNAMASNEILAKYGITQFPTSFLISPGGKIVRMNIRDESEYELIVEEIENYFK